MAFSVDRFRELTEVTTVEDTALGIMRWGTANCFPQTLKNLISKSPNSDKSIKRTTKFVKGDKFEGMDTIINAQGQTLGSLVAVLAKDYVMFGAFALHCNYNIKGEVASMYNISITDLRFNEFDELNYSSRIGYHQNFGRNSVVRKTIDSVVTKDRIKWIDRFNPEVALAQMNDDINKYNGQILYFSEEGYSSYPEPPLQSIINYVLSDVDNSVLMRKETSTGFVSAYLLKTTLSDGDPILSKLEESIEMVQGVDGTGGVITFSDLSPEDVQSTLLEEIGGGSKGANSIVEKITKAYELNQKVITGAYLIPDILAGVEVSTGFSTSALKDAYFVFNTQTQDARNTIEQEINKILKYANFSIDSIKLNKLKLDEEELKELEQKPFKKW